MDGIVKVFTQLPDTKAKKDDDFVDRLSSRYTVVILVVFAIVVSMSQLVGNPITCWVPVHFTGSHTKFTNSYCWVRNTYYLPWSEEIPKEHEHEKRQTLPYYQWIPFILLTQAILFYFPSIIWHGMNQKAGVDADTILSTANTFNKADKLEARESNLRLITNQMDRFLGSRGYKNLKKEQEGTAARFRKILNTLCCNMCGRRYGSYLVVLYLFTKVLYIVNAVAQLFLLNKVLGTAYDTYGVNVLKWIIYDDVNLWDTSPNNAFPRVTMCDFKVRRLGNVHRYTVQCTLPINLYNEKIYMFLWFWMCFVAICTLYSFVTWLLNSISGGQRVNFIKGFLTTSDEDNNKTYIKDTLGKDKSEQVLLAKNNDIEEFATHYLLQDGVFLLRLIEHNTNGVTVQEIIDALFEKWLNKKNTHKPTLEEENDD